MVLRRFEIPPSVIKTVHQLQADPRVYIEGVLQAARKMYHVTYECARDTYTFQINTKHSVTYLG